MMPREQWTDQRLDDLNKKVDDGFARVEKKMDDGFARADRKMNDGFARVDKDIREIRGEIRDLKSEMNRTVYGAVVVIVAAVIGNNALF